MGDHSRTQEGRPETAADRFSWKDVSEWNSVGWYVAFLVAVWGVLLSTGDYVAADVAFGAAVLAFAVKWGHFSQIQRKGRNVGQFTVGALFALCLLCGEVWWAHSKMEEEIEKSRQLSKLSLLPGLQTQVDRIPSLEKELEDLKRANEVAAKGLSEKQDTIKKLSEITNSQQQSIAKNAQKDLMQATALLNSNINQYRTDTTTAVSRIMRPPRTLGDKTPAFVSFLKQSGPHEIAITPAHGSDEALKFANEIEAAFKAAGWTIVRTKRFAIMVTDGEGLRLVTKDLPGKEIKWADLTPAQAAVGQAFALIQTSITADAQANGEEGPTEIYVGLQ